MYLSDNDLREAVERGRLIFEPRPQSIDPTSIDLHLDRVGEARVWDVASLSQHQMVSGVTRPEVRIGTYTYSAFSGQFLTAPPPYDVGSTDNVQLRGNQVVVRPGGFLLWQTQEKVGTPADADLICFVNTKSTRARAGVMVHCAAPTIHSTWSGKITLEIVNLGPFDLILQAGNVIAQLTVARITSAPRSQMAQTSATYGQQAVSGDANPSPEGGA